MGIPGFYGRWLQNHVRQAIINGIPSNISSLSFDLNGVIHDAKNRLLSSRDPRLLQSLNPSQIENAIFDNINYIILKSLRNYSPKDTLILAVDGVAPSAKLQQQKSRRQKAERSNQFDGNSITPGTDFMLRLDAHIRLFISQNRLSLPPTVVYSSHLVPGEGEHKIMDYFRQNFLQQRTSGNNLAHIIYGLDADLIMLSLLVPADQIYLSRETVKESVSIDVLRQYLMTRLNKPTALVDFVLMSYLLGNDFLPHAPALQSLEDTVEMFLQTYIDLQVQLTDQDHNIQWSEFAKFMKSLADRELDFLLVELQRDVKYPSQVFKAGFNDAQQFDYRLYRRAWYQKALGPKGPASLQESILGVISMYSASERELQTNTTYSTSTYDTWPAVTIKHAHQMVYDYLRTLAWTLVYYTEGTTAVNIDWMYGYYYTPLLKDISNILNSDTFVAPSQVRAWDGMLQFTALHQLVAVLPLHSKDLIPRELQILMTSNSPIADLYPQEVIIDYDGVDADYKAVALVPLIDKRRIIEAVEQIYLSFDMVKNYMRADDLIIELAEHEKQAQATRNYISNISRGSRGTRGQFAGRSQGRESVARSVNRSQRLGDIVPASIVRTNINPSEQTATTVTGPRRTAGVFQLDAIIPNLSSDSASSTALVTRGNTSRGSRTTAPARPIPLVQSGQSLQVRAQQGQVRARQPEDLTSSRIRTTDFLGRVSGSETGARVQAPSNNRSMRTLDF